MGTQTLPILLNLLAAVLGAVGQYLYKIGGLRVGLEPIYKNWPILLGLILFCVVSVLFVASYKLGGKLSIVYPVYATTFVWGTLIATSVDREAINTFQVAGVLTIVLGVGLVALGGAR